jgi:RING-type zinc-finger
VESVYVSFTFQCLKTPSSLMGPSRLGCGHTFCQSCLEDWLSTTLAQHMTNHPNYNAHPPIPPHIYGLPRHMQQQALLQLAPMQPPPPKYTCPTCRQEVKSKPAETFALKAIVRTVANAMGERSPRKSGPVMKKGANGSREGPWDGFFPSPIVG